MHRAQGRGAPRADFTSPPAVRALLYRGRTNLGETKPPTEWAQQVGAKGQAGRGTCKPQAGALGQEQGLGVGGAGLPALRALTPQLLTSPKLPIRGREREPQGPGA